MGFYGALATGLICGTVLAIVYLITEAFKRRNRL